MFELMCHVLETTDEERAATLCTHRGWYSFFLSFATAGHRRSLCFLFRNIRRRRIIQPGARIILELVNVQINHQETICMNSVRSSRTTHRINQLIRFNPSEGCNRIRHSSGSRTPITIPMLGLKPFLFILIFPSLCGGNNPRPPASSRSARQVWTYRHISITLLASASKHVSRQN
jgi:hypothetical protein